MLLKERYVIIDFLNQDLVFIGAPLFGLLIGKNKRNMM